MPTNTDLGKEYGNPGAARRAQQTERDIASFDRAVGEPAPKPEPKRSIADGPPTKRAPKRAPSRGRKGRGGLA